MPHSHAPVKCVPVPPALAFPHDIARVDEIRDDALRRPFCYPHSLGNVAKPRVGIALDAEEHLGVAREKVPALSFRT